MRCILRKAALIVVVCCKIHNCIIDLRIAREVDDIDHGSGVPAGSDPLKDVRSGPDIFSQDTLHCEPEIADLTIDYLADPTYQEEYRLLQQLVKKDGLLFDKQGRLCVPDRSTRLVLIVNSVDLGDRRGDVEEEYSL
jgi:hypothetical protein